MPATRDKDSVRFRQIDIVSDDVKMLQDEIVEKVEKVDTGYWWFT